jgi:hypothetical protein
MLGVVEVREFVSTIVREASVVYVFGWSVPRRNVANGFLAVTTIVYVHDLIVVRVVTPH